MDAAVDGRRRRGLVRPAHSLKSNALSFGATRLAELSARSRPMPARAVFLTRLTGWTRSVRELVEVEQALRAERDAGP